MRKVCYYYYSSRLGYDTMFAGTCLPIDVVLYPRRLESLPTVLQECKILLRCNKVSPEPIFHYSVAH